MESVVDGSKYMQKTWNDTDRKAEFVVLGDKPVPMLLLRQKNPTQTGFGSNQNIRIKWPVADRLSHGIVSLRNDRELTT
jgi:hypothetical protein